MKALYGDGYANVRKTVRMLHPALDRWMVEFLYGRMLSRGVMTLRCVVAVAKGGHILWILTPDHACADKGCCARSWSCLEAPHSPSSRYGGTCQVYWRSLTGAALQSTIYSCLKAGASMEDVRGILDQTGLVWGSEAQRAVDAIWADFNIKRFEELWLKGHEAGGKLVCESGFFALALSDPPYRAPAPAPQEIIWDHKGDLASSTALAEETWRKFTFDADDKALAPPTERHINHPHLAELPRRRVFNHLGSSSCSRG